MYVDDVVVVVVPVAATRMPVRIDPTTPMIALHRYHHQYSLRLARPLNVAYFRKNRENAFPKEMPYQGAQSGGSPPAPAGVGCPPYGFCGWW